MLTLLLAALQTADWSITAERTNFRETGRYEEALSFCRRLDEAGEEVSVVQFGLSPQGRPIVALVLSREKAFSANRAAESSKPLVLVVNGIHSGEIEGKDASLMLARDIVFQESLGQLLDKVNIAIVPVFSVDAHERFGPFNRINQNGPEEMGWRATAQNLNLNRDWLKSDAPEMVSMIRFISQWKPDFIFDNHTTNGGDWQYVIHYASPVGPTQDPRIAAWTKGMYEAVLPKVTADGFPNAPYFGNVDPEHPERGVTLGDSSPRFSTGYMAAINRPGILVETHMLKPYEPRVRSTYSMMHHIIEHIASTGEELRRMTTEADLAGVAAGSSVALSSRAGEARRPWTFLGYEYTPYKSEVTGAMVRAWNRTKPIQVQSSIRDTLEPLDVVEAPFAYAVPPQWQSTILALSLHAIAGVRTDRESSVVAEEYRFTEVTFPTAPFEGRFQPTYKFERSQAAVALPRGTAVFLVGQPRGKLLMHMLEPAGPDALVRWGFFNAIFELKEYYEDYALEPLVRQWLEASPKLRDEFEERKKDEAFAKDARAILDWFYSQSSYYDSAYRRYPVVRLDENAARALLGGRLPQPASGAK